MSAAAPATTGRCATSSPVSPRAGGRSASLPSSSSFSSLPSGTGHVLCTRYAEVSADLALGSLAGSAAVTKAVTSHSAGSVQQFTQPEAPPVKCQSARCRPGAAYEAAFQSATPGAAQPPTPRTAPGARACGYDS